MVMINLFCGRGCSRIIVIVIALVLVTAVLLLSTGSNSLSSWRSSRLLKGTNNSVDGPTNAGSGHSKGITYDLTTPPSTGCEDLVNDLQQQLIRTYSKLLKGVRYANIWGYLETENKGDAAIWTAQQILLSMLGIETMEACRYEYIIILLYPSLAALLRPSYHPASTFTIAIGTKYIIFESG
jgi:hypothetical protein